MSSRRSLLLLVVVGVAAITWAASRFSRQVSGRTEPDAGATGERVTLRFFRNPAAAPVVAMRDLDGREVSLASLRGKVVLVNFWATWCPACRTELPILDRLARGGRADLAVVAIATDRDRSLVAPFVRKLNLRHLTIGFDPGGLVARADTTDGVDTPFALYGMPISFLLGVTGQVEGYMTGEADWTSQEASRLFDYYAGIGAGG